MSNMFVRSHVCTNLSIAILALVEHANELIAVVLLEGRACEHLIWCYCCLADERSQLEKILILVLLIN